MRLEKLTIDNFDQFSSLLSGAEFGGCYCAVWRSHDDTWVKRCQDSSKPNLKITKENILKGHHIVFLFYEDKKLIGWTGSGPKNEYPSLENKLGSRLTAFDSKIWSIGCIAVKECFRGLSKSVEIINAVIVKQKNQELSILKLIQ